MNKKTLLAGGVFVAFVLAAFFVLRAPDKGERTAEAPRPVPKLTDFDTLEVTKDDKTTVVKKEGMTYKVSKPVVYAADQDGAKAAFEGLEKLEFGNVVSDQKAKHEEFEVGAKGLRVVVKKGDKALTDLRIGKSVNAATLVRVEGKDEVWQAVGLMKYNYDKDPGGWRDKSITTFEEPQAETIEVVSKAGGRIALKKPPKPDGGADTEWSVVESTVKVEPFDKTVAPGIVSALYSWKTNDFADDAKPADTGLDAPDVKVTVGLRGGAKHTVLIGKKKGDEDYYVKTEDKPQVFLVKKYNLERILKRPIDFREKVICNLNEGEIVEVDVARDKESFTLVKDAKKAGDEAWSLKKPTGVTLDPSKVSSILSAFRDWKAAGFADDHAPKSTGLDKPQATVVAKSNVKGSGCTFKVGSESSDKQNYHIAKPGQPEVMVVAKWAADRILQKVDDLKKK
jgi:hypothetical protein